MESAAVRLYFLLEHNYSLVTMSCILHIIWVNSCTRNKINFSKDNIARGLCTLVLFIIFVTEIILNIDVDVLVMLFQVSAQHIHFLFLIEYLHVH